MLHFEMVFGIGSGEAKYANWFYKTKPEKKIYMNIRFTSYSIAFEKNT